MNDVARTESAFGMLFRLAQGQAAGAGVREGGGCGEADGSREGEEERVDRFWSDSSEGSETQEERRNQEEELREWNTRRE